MGEAIDDTEWSHDIEQVCRPGYIPYEGRAKLLCLQGDEDWDDYRRLMITASDAAAITGDIEFRPPGVEEKSRKAYNQVIVEKVRGVQRRPNTTMWFGQARERCNMEIFSALSGCTAEPCAALYASADFPFIGATPDGRVTCVDRLEPEHCGLPEDWESLFTDEELDRIESVPDCIVEMKNVRSKYRSQVKDAVPKSRWCQVQVQMLVTCTPLAICCSAVDACEMYAHIVYRDQAYQSKFIDCATKAHQEIMSWLE